MIFQHPTINRAHRDKRGKIARAMAAKISIAAKSDAFTHRDISKSLIEELTKRIEEIKKL